MQLLCLFVFFLFFFFGDLTIFYKYSALLDLYSATMMLNRKFHAMVLLNILSVAKRNALPHPLLR